MMLATAKRMEFSRTKIKFCVVNLSVVNNIPAFIKGFLGKITTLGLHLNRLIA